MSKKSEARGTIVNNFATTESDLEQKKEEKIFSQRYIYFPRNSRYVDFRG